MPIKTHNKKWKWGNIERSSKKELVQTVYGIWKKNGSKGSFSDFWHGKHKTNESFEVDKISELCKAVAKHKVEDEDGERISVAFGGNCGIFAYTLLIFLTDIDYDFDEWEFGFLFDRIESLSEIYKDNNDADLNHVVAIIDGKAYDGFGKTNPNEWHGKIFKIDDVEKAADIIDQFTVRSIDFDDLYKMFEAEWKNINKKKKMNESSERIYAYHCTNVDPEKIKKEGWKVGDTGFTVDNMFKDLYENYLPQIPVFISRIDIPVWSVKSKYCLKIDITDLDLFPDFGYLPDFGAYYDYDEECFYWENEDDLDSNKKLKDFVLNNCDNLTLYADCFDGEDSFNVLGTACVAGADLNRLENKGIVEYVSKDKKANESVVLEKKFNLYKNEADTDKLWFHGTNLEVESFKTRPPTPDNIFYIAENKTYAKKYGKNLYAIKLSDKLNPFNISDEKCQKDIEDNFPKFVSFAWVYGLEAAYLDGFTRDGKLKAKPGKYSPVDLLELAVDLYPTTDDRPYCVATNWGEVGRKQFRENLKKDYEDYKEWLKQNGFNSFNDKKIPKGNSEIIRKILIKKLHDIGYNSYLGIEARGMTRSLIIGLFDINAIDKIGPYDSKKKDIANESYERPYTLDTIKQKYGVETYRKLRNDPVHRFRAETGIEVIHKEPTKDEFERIVKNWDLMDDEMKKQSDEFSVKQFGKNNKDRIEEIRKSYMTNEAHEVHSYPEKLRSTIDRITKDVEPIYIDHAYFNKEGKFIWMMNSKGYIHVFKPVKLLNVKWKPFAFKDLLLQDDGMLKEVDRFRFDNGDDALKFLKEKYHFDLTSMSIKK